MRSLYVYWQSWFGFERKNPCVIVLETMNCNCLFECLIIPPAPALVVCVACSEM